MNRVSTKEFESNVSGFSDAAEQEPVIITSQDKDRLVLLSAQEYKRLAETASTVERHAMMRERAAYHSNTLTELSKR